MCGIAGIIKSDAGRESRQRVLSMLGALEHRGPDDEGLHRWNDAVFGHRRLSIFDLTAAGHQPMLSRDEKIGVVFNGAIYNFRELRAELEKSGAKFSSETDTEVLLHGYRVWGFDALMNKLDGMFALALWDDELRRLYLVRDRLGVKPLVFAVRDGEFAFASTVRALKKAGFGGELSIEGIAEYLEFGFLTDENSIYQGIEKLHAGELLEWHEGSISRRFYWDLPTNFNKISFEDAVDQTEDLILKAVEKRLFADVPVGALLSGGIDSSLVCWAISKLGGDVSAFTIGTANDEFDESGTAARTAQRLGIEHKVLELSGEEPPGIDDLIRAFGEPFACASALGMLAISRMVKQSATVLLTGDGGDDVFLGYPEHKHFRLSSKIASSSPEFAAGAWRSARSLIPKTGQLKRAVSLLDYSFGGIGAVGSARDGLPVYFDNGLIGERLRDITISHREMDWSIDSGRNLLSEFLTYDRKTRFTGEYLPKVDGATMFYALEARSPFLDITLWEFASSLPFSIRLHGGTLKAVLREIARRRIGEDLAAAKKQGFIIPVQKWLTGHWREIFNELMRDSILKRERLIDTEAAIKLLEKHPKNSWAPRQLWFLFVLESWLRFESSL